MRHQRNDIRRDYEAARSRKRILWAAICANLFANINLSGVNVALPAIQKALGLSAVAQVWVSSSLLLATAAVIAPAARLADTWGRRKTTVLGLAVIIASSVCCGLADSAFMLLAGRVCMGLGLAMVFSATMAMAASVFPADKRGLVFGYIVSAVYIGLAAGPGLCGLLVDLLGWESVFWLLALIMMVPLALLLTVRIDWAEAEGESYDYLGAILWCVALSLIFTGLTRLLVLEGILMTLAGAAFLLLFIRCQLKAEKPLLDLRLFASPRFSMASLAAFIAYSSAMSAIFLLSLYFQYIHGLSAKEAGLYLMLQPAVQALVTPFAGRLSDSRDPGRVAAAGLIITTIAFLLISLNLSADTDIKIVLALLAVFGVGFAVFAAPNSNAVMSSVPVDKLGVASGIITATRLSGQIFSLSFISLIFSAMMGEGHITPDLAPKFLEATRLSFMVFTPLCFAGALISLFRDNGGGTPSRRLKAKEIEADV